MKRYYKSYPQIELRNYFYSSTMYLSLNCDFIN